MYMLSVEGGTFNSRHYITSVFGSPAYRIQQHFFLASTPCIKYLDDKKEDKKADV